MAKRIFTVTLTRVEKTEFGDLKRDVLLEFPTMGMVDEFLGNVFKAMNAGELTATVSVTNDFVMDGDEDW